MTSATELLDRATKLGAQIWVDAGCLEVEVPTDFPEALVYELRTAKPELITLLAEPEPPSDEPGLLAWAAELAEGDLELDEPVRFVESPLRVVTTKGVSRYVRKVLRTLSYTKANEATGGWEGRPPGWWIERTKESVVALAALREAVSSAQETAT